MICSLRDPITLSGIRSHHQATPRAWAGRSAGTPATNWSSGELARRLFARKGFVIVERQDLAIRGVPIHNYRMAKVLD
jgi:hypothetical protein